MHGNLAFCASSALLSDTEAPCGYISATLSKGVIKGGFTRAITFVLYTNQGAPFLSVCISPLTMQPLIASCVSLHNPAREIASYLTLGSAMCLCGSLHLTFVFLQGNRPDVWVILSCIRKGLIHFAIAECRGMG